MSQLDFEWDPKKDSTNFSKHGISFNEAKTVFTDQYARLLVVCHCVRKDQTIRLISARRADKQERLIYEDFRYA